MFQAGEKLIQIPHAALLNRSTIGDLYTSELLEGLTATQLLSLHLCLYRHADPGPSENYDLENETFIPYIRSLPLEFDTVPLGREISEETAWMQIRKQYLLPEGLKGKTEDVRRRFDSDWKKTERLWVRNIRKHGYKPPASSVRILCVHIRVSPRVCTNLTLCRI